MGRQADREASQIAQLEDPLIRRELSRLESGRDMELPIGRLQGDLVLSACERRPCAVSSSFILLPAPLVRLPAEQTNGT